MSGSPSRWSGASELGLASLRRVRNRGQAGKYFEERLWYL
jgi:hypothetical protein